MSGSILSGPIDVVAETAGEHVDKLSLEIAKDGGGQLSYTHLPTIIGLCCPA